MSDGTPILVHEGERHAIKQTVCAGCGAPVVLRSRRWRYGPETRRPLDGMTHTWECPEHGLTAGLTTVPYGPLMPRWPEDHVRKPEPDHTRADLKVGRTWLAEEAENYVPARERAPGPIVPCSKCGCHVAIPERVDVC